MGITVTADDTFGEQRRAWIAAHAGIWLFQKRRAELLGKQLRAQARARVGARPDPHDDDVTPPLMFRRTSTATGAAETGLVVACAVAAPLGWTLGRLLYGWIITLIPEKLRAYPIPALLWGAVVCGAPLPLLYDPAPGLMSMVVAPWMLAQIPATFLAAGFYGVLEGWLVVDGSSDWWPLTPVAASVDDDVFLGTRDVAMPTVLDPSPREPEPLAVPRRRTPPTIRWVPLLSACALSALGILWYVCAVGSSLMDAPAQLIESNTHSETWR